MFLENLPKILRSGLWRTYKKKLSEIGQNPKQIEFECNTWKLRTKKTEIDFFASESIYNIKNIKKTC